MERNPEHKTNCSRSTLWCCLPHSCRPHFELVPTPDTLETGDLIFFETEALGGSLTRLCTGIRWDHVGIVIHSVSGSFTLECVADGVKFYHLHQRLNDVVVRRLAVRRLQFPEIRNEYSPLQRLIKTEPRTNPDGTKQWPEILTREYVIRRLSDFVTLSRNLNYVAPLRTWCWLTCCVVPTIPVQEKVQIRSGQKSQSQSSSIQEEEKGSSIPASRYFAALERSHPAPCMTEYADNIAPSSLDISFTQNSDVEGRCPTRSTTDPHLNTVVDIEFPGTVPLGDGEKAEEKSTGDTSSHNLENLVNADESRDLSIASSTEIQSVESLNTQPLAGRSSVRNQPQQTTNEHSTSSKSTSPINERTQIERSSEHEDGMSPSWCSQYSQNKEVSFDQISNMIKYDEDGALYCSSYIAACFMYAGLFTMHPHTTYYMPFDFIHESETHLPWRQGSGISLGEVQVIPKHRMGMCTCCCTTSPSDVPQPDAQ